MTAIVTKPDRLSARVHAVNTANAYANELYQLIAPIIDTLKGEPLYKTTGGFLKKVEKLLPTLPNTPALHVYRSTINDYNLVFHVKTCVFYPGRTTNGVVYHTTPVYIANTTSGGIVKDLLDAPNFRSDFTPEEIIQKRADYRTAKKAADDALSALEYFGADDNSM